MIPISNDECCEGRGLAQQSSFCPGSGEKSQKNPQGRRNRMTLINSEVEVSSAHEGG